MDKKTIFRDKRIFPGKSWAAATVAAPQIRYCVFSTFNPVPRRENR